MNLTLHNHICKFLFYIMNNVLNNNIFTFYFCYYYYKSKKLECLGSIKKLLK